MNFRQNIAYFIRHLREKHRLSVRNQHTDREIWYMHISPLNLLAGLLALILILFILIASTVAYTPVLDLLPGLSRQKVADDARREHHASRLARAGTPQHAGIQRKYRADHGRAQPGHAQRHAGSRLALGEKGATVAAIAEDSLLRAQMETPGSPYSLYDPDAARKNLRSAMELFAPVKGVVTARFSPIDNRFGVSLATTSNQQVMAVMDGTVISAPWTPEDGFVLYVQHANNMISVYRHNVSVLKKAGDRVSSGEIIGYTGGENAPGQTRTCSNSSCGTTAPLSTRRDISFSELPETRENTTSGG